MLAYLGFCFGLSKVWDVRFADVALGKFEEEPLREIMLPYKQERGVINVHGGVRVAVNQAGNRGGDAEVAGVFGSYACVLLANVDYWMYRALQSRICMKG